MENYQNMRYKTISKNDSLIAKGVAIIAVIISHLPRITDLPTIFESAMHPFGYLGVSIFLVLSGYGITVSVNSTGV